MCNIINKIYVSKIQNKKKDAQSKTKKWSISTLHTYTQSVKTIYI